MNLLPCPFCGREDISVRRQEVFDRGLMKYGGKAFQIIVFCRCSAQVDTIGFSAQNHTDEEIRGATIDKWNARHEISL